MKENLIYNEGAKLLGKALRHNNSVLILDLSHNVIDDDGAVALCKRLLSPHECEDRYHITLQRVDLSGNKIYGGRSYTTVMDKLWKLEHFVLDSTTFFKSHMPRRTLLLKQGN